MFIFKRINNAHKRLKCAAFFTKCYFSAIHGFVRYKINPSYTMKGTFRGLPFRFRSSDIEALNEVLLNEEYNFLADFLKQNPNPLIIDAGHHIGCFSLWLLSKQPKSKIIALEADPNTYSIAKQNAALPTQNAHWTVLHKAAWENDDSISFSVEGNTMGHKVSDTGNIAVQGISLKTLLDMTSKQVTLMKVDIEGAEEAFLNGNAALIREKVKALVIEIHPNYCNESNVRAILKESFDNIITIDNTQTNKPLLWCYN
jgi:FkbM family methyltransferase